MWERTVYNYHHAGGFRFLNWIVPILSENWKSCVFVDWGVLVNFTGVGEEVPHSRFVMHSSHLDLSALSQDTAFSSFDSCFSLFPSPICRFLTTLL